MNVSKSTVSVICSKTKNPTFGTLKKLSIVLDIELEDLFKAVAEAVETR
ncbi:MAG TPA: hypothetical protein DF613_14055 [Lachnospiraceae bacterium]|nr:hypothetical protein [Lachnospiraceae bacterium]